MGSKTGGYPESVEREAEWLYARKEFPPSGTKSGGYPSADERIAEWHPRNPYHLRHRHHRNTNKCIGLLGIVVMVGMAYIIWKNRV